MRNKRNTRRNRAKRWWQPYPGVWILRGTGWTVLRTSPWSDWAAYDAGACSGCRQDASVFFHNRSSAMRAAEGLSRDRE